MAIKVIQISRPFVSDKRTSVVYQGVKCKVLCANLRSRYFAT